MFGAVTAPARWLYLIHILVMAGYRLILGLDIGVTSPSPTSVEKGWKMR